jgi:hypothetical protein
MFDNFVVPNLLPAVPKIELWNEFNPYLYNISAQLDVDSLVSDKTETERDSFFKLPWR